MLVPNIISQCMAICHILTVFNMINILSTHTKILLYLPIGHIFGRFSKNDSTHDANHGLNFWLLHANILIRLRCHHKLLVLTAMIVYDVETFSVYKKFWLKKTHSVIIFDWYHDYSRKYKDYVLLFFSPYVSRNLPDPTYILKTLTYLIFLS